MGFGFLNAWMLLGLAGVALPVFAHLISKRRFDVVHWGAMRFLELGQRTRRRIRLQDLLLLLLRMSLLALLALALSRPWGTGRLLGALGSEVLHDYVFVLDGSTSMAWQGADSTPSAAGAGPMQTPHQQAVQWVFDALEELSPGDTVSLIDARNHPRRLLFPPTTDHKAVREALTKIAEPAGTSQLPQAIHEGLKILATTTNVSRRLVVLTDRQSLAWQPDDEFAWVQVDELRKQSKTMPVIHPVFFGPQNHARTNFSVGRIELSRAVTVPEFPVQVRAMIRQSGGANPSVQKAVFLVDGQQIPGKFAEVTLLPDGEAIVEFDHVFPAEGNFLVSIALEPDLLPNDNRSQAIVSITSSLPVLLVDGDRQIDSTRSETFYLQSVFASSGINSPWIQAEVIPPHELNEARMAGQQVVFLCNIDKLSQRQWEGLRKFVRDGGGLVIAPGDKVLVNDFNQVDAHEKNPFLPARLQQLVQSQQQATATAGTIDSLSLSAAWLQRFRQENGVDFTQSRNSKWYRLEPIHPPASAATSQPGAAAIENPVKALAEFTGTSRPRKDADVQVLARFANGDPWLLRRDYGYGSILQLAAPLDADWSTLPAKNDFVPFLHELVFSLTSSVSRRNVDVGIPLLLSLKPGESAKDYVINGPGIIEAPAEPEHRGRNAFAQFRQTVIPGLYSFQKKNDRGGIAQRFIVDDDHRESNLSPLTESDWKSLTANGRLSPVETMRQVTAAAASEGPHTELGWLLLLAVLVLLVSEVALTRKMVQGGHSAVDDALTASTP